MHRIHSVCVGMIDLVMISSLLLGTTTAAVATTAAAATTENSYNNRIMEEELTHILQEALAWFDPYLISYTSTLSYTNSTSSIELNVTNIMLSGFGEIIVTKFEPPIHFLSKQVTIETVVSNLTLSTDNYSMITVCDMTNEVYKYHGSAFLVFNNLKVIQQFKADEYSTDPVRICVQCGTLTIDISYDSVEGNFEGAGLLNSMIPKFGEQFIEQIMINMAENQEILEDSLNNALCSSKDIQRCRREP